MATRYYLYIVNNPQTFELRLVDIYNSREEAMTRINGYASGSFFIHEILQRV